MNMTSLLVGAGAGAGLMYLLDPDQGNRRRALVRDQLVHAGHLTGDAVDATSRDVRNRARGVVAELRSRLSPERVVPDDRLRERVRARLGQIVRYAHSIEATVEGGRVTLRGPALADDVAGLVRRLGRVPGVQEVDNQLELHAEPGNVPGLQGAQTSRGQVLPFRRGALSPTARLATSLGGAMLALWGLRRLDAVGAPVAMLGMAMLARGVGAPPLSDLVDDLRRALPR
jgi:hypothetical protein